eukprot:PhM_4_TR11671/c0_g1_i2/m.13344
MMTPPTRTTTTTTMSPPYRRSCRRRRGCRTSLPGQCPSSVASRRSCDKEVREAYLRRTGAMADAADMMSMPSSATSPLRPQPPPRRNWRQRQDEIANARALEEARAVEREVRRHVRRARWLVKDTQRRTN